MNYKENYLFNKLLKNISFFKTFGKFIGLLLFMELVVYRDFIFGNKLLIFKDLGSDSYNGNYPFYTSLIRHLTQGETPQWSFHLGMGENIYPFSFDFIATPLLYLFFRHDIAAGMLWIQLVYTFLSGIFFFLFLRSLRFTDFVTLIGGLCYAFSSFAVAYGSWTTAQFSAVPTQFAFLLFALSQFIQHRNKIYYPFAIAMIAIHQPFHIYFAAIISLIYCVLFYYSTTKTSKNIKISTKIFQLALAGLLGLGVSAFMLLSNLYQMLNSPRGSGEFNFSYSFTKKWYELADKIELKTNFLRLFSPNMEGSAIQYTGFYNYLEAPFLYCGLFILLLIPQLFVFLPKKEKIGYGLLLLFMLLLFVFPYTRYVLWLFAGNYYRILGLFFVIFALFYSLKALDFILKGRELNRILLLVSAIFCLSLLFYNKPNADFILPNFTLLILLFLLQVGLLYFYSLEKIHIYRKVFLGLTLLEIFIITSPILSERNTCSHEDIYGKIGYNDKTVAAVDYLKQQDKTFWRLEKDYFSGLAIHASLNDAQVQNYYGTTIYNSFNNVNLIRFLVTIGELKVDNENATRWIISPKSPFTMRLCGIKYFLSQAADVTNYQNQDFTFLQSFEPVKVLAVNNYLPFGSTFSKYISLKNFEQLSPQNKQKTILQAVVVENNAIENMGKMRFFEKDTTTTISKELLNSWVNELKKDTLQISQFTNNEIQGTINLSEPKLLFFPIPYHKGWHLEINNKETEIEKFFGGLMGVTLPQGNHTITLSFTDPYKNIGLLITLISSLVLIMLYFFPLDKRIYVANKKK